MMGHLNSFLAQGGGNLNKNFPKIQMPGGLLGGGGMLKLRFDWYIMLTTMVTSNNSCSFLLVSMMNSSRVSMTNVAIKDWKGQSPYLPVKT